MLGERHKATSVVVPDLGWYIFGDASVYRNQSFSIALKDINSEWERGPDQIEGTDMTGFCAVQVRILI